MIRPRGPQFVRRICRVPPYPYRVAPSHAVKDGTFLGAKGSCKTTARTDLKGTTVGNG